MTKRKSRKKLSAKDIALMKIYKGLTRYSVRAKQVAPFRVLVVNETFTDDIRDLLQKHGLLNRLDEVMIQSEVG